MPLEVALHENWTGELRDTGLKHPLLSHEINRRNWIRDPLPGRPVYTALPVRLQVLMAR